jgi:hypothetical protein
MSLRVIGAGFGRTGTASLKVALERLGFAPCDHMGEVFLHPERALIWEEAADAKARGEAFDWARLYAGYAATTDWPGAYFWRELAAAYPAAKVVLSVRDPERWYDSMRRTVYRLRHSPEAMATLAEAFGVRSFADWMPRFTDRLVWEGTFGGRFEDRAHALRVFTEHAAAVRAAIPPDRLLVFEVGEGWEPLCRFLGVPAPAGESFPHVNDAATVEAQLRQGPDKDVIRRMLAGEG